MKTLSYLSLPLSFLVSLNAVAMENCSLAELRENAKKIHATSLMAPSHLGKIDLYKDQEGFTVVQNENEVTRIKSHDMDPMLRTITLAKLAKLQEGGYLKVNRMNNGDYSLVAHASGNGGFILTGVIVYQSCRVIGYTGLVLGSMSTVAAGLLAGGPAGAFVAASAVISASAPAAAAIETGSLAIGTAASFIPLLP